MVIVGLTQMWMCDAEKKNALQLWGGIFGLGWLCTDVGECGCCLRTVQAR